ncbi:hypothetical protein AB0K14_38355 [Actinosynnema sp. NPDC050801]|uniref:hypothetical protein n=1 Tax=unclassified Actinosynnema TaxID=2637065 RepID=UPI0033F2E6D1
MNSCGALRVASSQSTAAEAVEESRTSPPRCSRVRLAGVVVRVQRAKSISAAAVVTA